MNKIEGNVKNCKTKKVTLWVVPFFNHWYGLEVYFKKPIIDQYGVDTTNQRPYETSCQQFFSYIGVDVDYKNFDYEFYYKKYDDWAGGLMANIIKVTATVLVDKDGNVMIP